MAFSQINSFSSFINNPNTTRPDDISSTSLDYWFKFNSGDIVSNRLYNYATSSYNATVYSGSINTTTYKTGSGSLYLSGSSQYVDIDDFTTSTGGITIACWVKTSTTGWARIFDFGITSSSENILFSPNNGPSVYRGTTAFQPGGSTWQFANGSWNHLIWTLSASTGTTCTWNIYKNGSNIYTSSSANYPKSTVTRTNNYIGRSNWSADPYLTGYLDDFRIYSRAISSSEALQLYNHTK